MTPRKVAVTAAVVLAVWGLALAQAALGARADLLEAEASLEQARSALADGDLDGALEDLSTSSALLGGARSALFRPYVSAAAAVPWLSNDLRIARDVAAAADDVVTVGQVALRAADDLANQDLEGGVLPVTAIEDMAPRVRDAATTSNDAVARVAAAPTSGFLATTTQARLRFLEILGPVANDLAKAADLLDALPTFLGADGARRYLVGAANPAELRGVGGYLGSYSILTIDDGHLDFGSFLPLFDLEPLPPGAVPADLLAERYERFGGTWQWKNTNMTPDMPSVGRALTTMWLERTGRQLDGVIIVDPFALATMLESTGPTTTSEGIVLTAENAVDYLTNEAYADFEDSTVRKEALGDNAKMILSSFLASPGAAKEHLDDLSAMVAERHVQLYATDPTIQRAFAAAGIDGALPDPEGDFLEVVANSASNSKVDYYLETALEYRVELLADFAAQGRLEVRLDNTAPGGRPRSHVLGPNVDGLAAGGNRLYLSTYCATACTFEGAEGGLSGRSLVETELGHPVAGSWVEIPAGGTAELLYQWRTDNAWRWEEGELVYELTVRPQVTVRAMALRVVVDVPGGFHFAGANEPAEVTDDEVSIEVSPRGLKTLQVRLRPSRDQP